ncbi:MAG: histidine phosphatase family protein [Tissierellaceae bacterium]|nr:histidine phosphatase family protein [Tissierellaceae bacterium]
MRLYFTRHGQTEWNVSGKLQGWGNSNLTEKGIESAKRLSSRLENVDFDIIISSPQKRALETAELIRGNKDTEIKTLEDIREIGFGSWEGMEIQTIRQKYSDEFDTYLNRPHLYKPIDGESFEEVYRRVENALDKILSMDAENILIVSHGVTIKVLTSIIKGIPMEELYKIPVQMGTALNICEYDGNKLRFLIEEDTSHII